MLSEECSTTLKVSKCLPTHSTASQKRYTHYYTSTIEMVLLLINESYLKSYILIKSGAVGGRRSNIFGPQTLTFDSFTAP